MSQPSEPMSLDTLSHDPIFFLKFNIALYKSTADTTETALEFRGPDQNIPCGDEEYSFYFEEKKLHPNAKAKVLINT
ncbi:hypothetical protein QTP88_007778 [Uroleucon formosanum]